VVSEFEMDSKLDQKEMGLPKNRARRKWARHKIQIVNDSGLHARPAAEFVRTANSFRAEIWLVKGKQRFSATSIVEVLTADLSRGDTTIIEAKGADSEQAVAELVKLTQGFTD
jgi:phosphocarrier protein HPr